MKRLVLLFLLIFFASNTKAQFNLIVNEFSQGNGGVKEFIELLVVGTRTCTDSTADIRNWIFDDQPGWYGAAGTGIAGGHYRFSNSTNWAQVPYGSILLLYNDADRNSSIPAGTDDPTDANHDYTYIIPISNNLIEQNSSTPVSPSTSNYTYPVTGYAPSASWSSLGLSNSGDAVVITNPSNSGIAHFSIIFGITAGAGFQTPTVTKANVAASKNCYLNDNLYSNPASWIIGNAGTANETPGNGNSIANVAWIESLRLQVTSVPALLGLTQPTCTTPNGTITVTAPVGAIYSYSIDGINFQSSPVFPGLAPNTYTVTVQATGGCNSTSIAVINTAPGSPSVPISTAIQPTCSTATGTITVTAPVGTIYSYSIDGTTFQASPVFPGLVPNTYTITVQSTGGCNSTGIAVINTAPGSPSVPTSTVIQPTCSTLTGIITVTTPVGTVYTYSIDGINFQASPVFPGLVPNTYTITVQATGGCSSTGTAVINTAPGSPSVPTSTVIHPTCSTATGTITVTAPVGTIYSYSIDGINFQASPVFPGLVPNTYTVTVQATGGCSSTGTATINNVPASPDPPSVISPVNYCKDVAPNPLTANGSNLLWYNSSAGGTGNSTVPVPSTSIPGTTTYYVTQTINGCESQRAAITVIVTGITVSPITGNTSLCLHDASGSVLSDATAGGTWSSADPSIATVDNNGLVTAVSEGSTNIIYTVNAGACSSSVQTTISVKDLILNLIATPNPANQGTIVSLNTNAALAYQVTGWLPLNVFPNQTAFSQSITASGSGTYFAIGQSSDGCIDTAQVFLSVTKGLQDIFVPNVFTPNNDGNNDILYVYGNHIKEIDLRIFNQWGEFIFRSNDKSTGWDGRYKGVKQPVTVYVYVLKATMLDGSVIKKKGSITLIR